MKNSKRGFTLIELMVVISIISLMSSVILSSMNSARLKARNAEKTQSLQQYIKAINLSYDKYGEYPDPGNTSTYCITDVADNGCGYTNATSDNSTLYSLILEFMPGARIFSSVPVSYTWGSTTSYEGPLYRCSTRTSNTCTAATITWMFEGKVSSCGFGGTKDIFDAWFSNATLCNLVIQ